jgi:hypothetical protein
MKVLILTACIFGPTANARAHDVEMPVSMHLAQHGWLFLALPALLAILSPLLRRHR